MHSDDGMAEPALLTDQERRTEMQQTGEIIARIDEAGRHQTLERDVDRFCAAREENWELIYAEVIDAQDSWQLCLDEPSPKTDITSGLDNGVHFAQNHVTLHDEACPTSVDPLVFKNGWIMREDAYWFHDPALVERIDQAVSKRTAAVEKRIALEDIIHHSDGRLIELSEPTPDNPTANWEFAPTGFSGTPPLVAAYAQGYDAAPTEQPEPAESESEHTFPFGNQPSLGHSRSSSRTLHD